jgi:hypothetical protein
MAEKNREKSEGNKLVTNRLRKNRPFFMNQLTVVFAPWLLTVCSYCSYFTFWFSGGAKPKET